MVDINAIFSVEHLCVGKYIVSAHIQIDIQIVHFCMYELATTVLTTSNLTFEKNMHT